MSAHRTRPWALAVAVLTGLTGCGSAAPELAQPPDDNAIPDLPASPVTVTTDGTVLELPPWTTCWSDAEQGGCWDGRPPDPLPDLGLVDGDVRVTFPHDGWQFDATYRAPGEHCLLALTADLVPVDERTWTLPATGPPGRYAVDVSGRGPEGDVIVTFGMQTTQDGEVPAPTATLEMIFDHDGVPVMYGPATVRIANLPRTPEDASAAVTVVSADDRRTEVELAQEATGCDPAGSVTLAETAAGQGERDAREAYGPEPYDLEIAVDLDGSEHVVTAGWPADEDADMMTIPLVFDPPLPTAEADDYAAYVE